MLNFKAVDLIIKYTASTKSGGYFEYKPMYVSQLPIAKASETQKDRIRNCVRSIMRKKEENPAADTSELETEINRLVYELYELTEEEIKIIEKT